MFKNDGKKKSALEKAYGILARRPYTEYQIRLKLIKSDYSEQEIDKAISELFENHYLDDNDYAERYLQILIEKQFGRRRMFDEMRRQGIAPTLAKEIISEGYSQEHERECAMRVAMRATDGLKEDASFREKARRISLKLTGKGFDYETIHYTIDHFPSL
ncbi:MAG: RecX family transcriptional regulator [Clostridiales Family XIII bacterium]|jgi:regulatory protein|nr:RecX family transcriptional regulator [Clostridiales Family XIII bacterium]